MTVIGVIAIFLLQSLMGWGVLRLLRVKLPPVQELGLSVMIGMGIGAMVPILLEVFKVSIDGFSIIVTHLILVAVLNFPHKFSLDRLQVYGSPQTFEIKFAELGPLLIAGVLLIPSYWACYYLPPVALDFLRGPAILSKFALEEGTIISSVFTKEVVYAGTNLYKPPFLLGQEINYQAMGMVYGKVWQIPLHLSFMMVLYNILRNKTHGLIAGVLLVFWIAIPEQYAHVYFVLHDLPHSIYLALVLYLLVRFLDEGEMSVFWLSVILSGLATLLRAENLLFIGLASMVFLIRGLRSLGWRYWVYNGVWIAAPVLVYVLWMQGFVAMIMPQGMEAADEVKTATFEIGSFMGQFSAIFQRLIISSYAQNLFLYFWYLLPILFIGNLIVKRSMKGWEWLVWIFCIYTAYALMLEMIPLVVLDFTVKRGLFKMTPLIILYAAHGEMLPWVGQKIRDWEVGNDKNNE